MTAYLSRKWLTEIRKQNKLSQEEMAGKIGISQTYYGQIEIGTKGKPLNVNVAKKIAEVLGFEWTKFYEEN